MSKYTENEVRKEEPIQIGDLVRFKTLNHSEQDGIMLVTYCDRDSLLVISMQNPHLTWRYNHKRASTQLGKCEKGTNITLEQE